MGRESVQSSVSGRMLSSQETLGPLSPAAAASDRTALLAALAPALSKDELGWLAHYRVVKVLGHGSMGIVLQAEDSHLRRTVALKIVLPDSARAMVVRERFLREARAAAALKNDHIITVYQVGQDRDVPFLAMEYLRGQSLLERLTCGAPLPLADIVRIGREIATGLAAAHAQGLIHRDIKPANIFLERKDGGGKIENEAGVSIDLPLSSFRAKILDFGLVRAMGGGIGLTHAGCVVGTPAFMSPEQARGREVTTRSDLFSLGAVLYTMCAGEVPFQADSVMGVLMAVAADEPRPVCELNPDVPPALAELIDGLLRKDPAQRPADAEEVRQALTEIELSLAPPAAHETLPTSLIRTEPGKPASVTRSRWLLLATVVTCAALLAAQYFLAGPCEHAPQDAPALHATSAPHQDHAR